MAQPCLFIAAKFDEKQNARHSRPDPRRSQQAVAGVGLALEDADIYLDALEASEEAGSIVDAASN